MRGGEEAGLRVVLGFEGWTLSMTIRWTKGPLVVALSCQFWVVWSTADVVGNIVRVTVFWECEDGFAVLLKHYDTLWSFPSPSLVIVTS